MIIYIAIVMSIICEISRMSKRGYDDKELLDYIYENYNEIECELNGVVYKEPKKRDHNFCMDCKLRKVVKFEGSILTCTRCGLCEYYPVYVASYNHTMQPLRRKCIYKRSDNFKVILNQFLYGRKKLVPDDVMETIRDEIHDETNILYPYEIPLTIPILECVSKRNELMMYKDTIYSIFFRLSGKSFPHITTKEYNMILNAFNIISSIYDKYNARFKRKKIRSMKCEADKIAEKLRESEATLKLLEPRVPKAPSGEPLKQHPLNRNKRIEAKIDELNKKIRRAKNRRNKEHLISKRNSLRLDLNWGPRLLEGAFDDAYRRYRKDGIPGMDPDTFLNRIRRFLIDLLKKESRMGAVRSQTATWVRFRKDRELVELAFNSRMTNIYNLSDMDEIVNEMIAHMKGQIENPALLNSRFVFDEVLFTNVNFHQLNLTRGSSYLPLPNWLALKKAIINPKNEDQECFKWAVIATSRWEEINNNPERISKLKRFEKDFDWSGIEFPVSVKDIKKFEFRNQISINLLAIEGKQIYICGKGGNYERIINLMLITGNNRKHYVAIKSLSRLLSSQNTKHKGKEYFCMNCLQGFNEESSRDEHLDYCINNESVKVEMQHKKPTVQYSDGQFQFMVPFIMYADFESILEPIQGLENNPRISSTRSINNHVPSGWCVHSEFAYGKVENPLKLYRREDCIKKFVIT